jgi:hypothetical protein
MELPIRLVKYLINDKHCKDCQHYNGCSWIPFTDVDKEFIEKYDICSYFDINDLTKHLYS